MTIFLRVVNVLVSNKGFTYPFFLKILNYIDFHLSNYKTFKR